MRCKRCGEPLEPMETRCPVCGKTVAPRRKTAAQRPGEASIKLPQLDRFTHAYSADAARSRMLQLVTILAVLAAIVLLVLVFVGVGDLKSAVKDLELTANAQLQAVQNQQNQTPEATAGSDETQTEPQEDPTENTGDVTDMPQTLPLSQQDVEAELTLYRSGSGTYAAASMDLGNYADEAAAWVNTMREGNSRETNVAWILSGTGDRLDMKLHDSYGGEEQVDITLSWHTEGDTFGSLGSPMCIWEYRLSGGSWESVPTEYLTPIGGGCELAFTAEELAGLLGEQSKMELRCRVSMTHAAGGSMSILVGGIAFDATGLTVSGDLLD